MAKECTIADINTNLTGVRVNDLGWYDSCLSNSSQNYYLLAKYYERFNFKNMDDFHPMQIYATTSFNFLGVCASAACSESSLASLYNASFDAVPKQTRKLGPLNITNVPQFLENSQKVNFSVISFWSILVVLAWFVIVTTFVNQKLRKKCYQILKEKSKEANSYPKFRERIVKKLETDPIRHFDLVLNFKKLTSPPKFKDGVSQTFTVARAFAMILVVLGHELTARLQFSDIYTAAPSELKNYYTKSPILGMAQMGIYSVSMFFFIGGFVSIIAGESFYKKALKVKRGCCSNYFYMVLRRYMRMAPVLIIVELYVGRVLRHMGDGPAAAVFAKHSRESCTTIRLLAEMSLLIPTQHCAIWVWYIQCDFNMFMVLLLVVFLTRSGKGKTIFMGVLIVLSVISSGVVLYLVYLYYGMLTSDVIYSQAFYRLRIYMTGCLVGYYAKRAVDKKKNEMENGKGGRQGEEVAVAKKRVLKGENGEMPTMEQTDEEKREIADFDQSKGVSGGEGVGTDDKNRLDFLEIKNEMMTFETERELELITRPLTTELLSKSKKTKIAKRRAKILDTGTLCAFLALLILMFLWYHSSFQSPHFKPTSPVITELIFYLFGPLLIVLSLLGVLYKVVTWNEGIKNALRNSWFVNLMANLSFCIYMSHYCVILTNSNHLTHQYTFHFYDIFGFYLTDFFYTFFSALFLALFVELPFGSLWRTYLDAWFLKTKKLQNP